MSESFCLPITGMLHAAIPAEPVQEGGEAGTEFTIEEEEPDILVAEDVAPDMPVEARAQPDRLQMLIEELSGITSAVAPSPQTGPKATPVTLPEPCVVAEAKAAVTTAIPAEPATTLAALPASPAPTPLPEPGLAADPGAIQIDMPVSDPAAPLPIAAREANGAPPDQPVRRVPVAAIVRQIAEAVVTAREDRIEIALAPEELGRIRMVMSGPDHNPHVVIWAERPEVLDQLRRNSAFLQECLGDAGMAEASFEFQGDGGTGTGPDDRQRLPDSAGPGADITDMIPAPPTWTPLAIPARLDIRI